MTYRLGGDRSILLSYSPRMIGIIASRCKTSLVMWKMCEKAGKESRDRVEEMRDISGFCAA
jgi:hypothetical protein